MLAPDPHVLSYDDLRQEAAEFREEYTEGEIPVDVERIVDVELGLDIVPVPHLRYGHDIDGFLSGDRSRIYVDKGVYDHNVLYRYRFTLAHEIAHYHLHEDLFESAEFDSVEEWKDFLGDMSDESHSWYEWQGYAFGGLLLVPREPLAEQLEEAKERARAEGFSDLDLSNDRHRNYVAEYVGHRFDVSGDVIERRGDKDGHWDR